MKIYDRNQELLALIVRSNDIKQGRNFLTENNEEFQIASFNFDEETIIDNHIHLKQDRKIVSTVEVLFVIEGSMEIFVYDEDLELIHTDLLSDGETIVFFRGGHGLKVKKGCKFVEAKQGPYKEELDKKRF
tara:strand:- start:1122 stop:1514 length:393 start_codon:yes stop_codon:yes gene_type:complete